MGTRILRTLIALAAAGALLILTWPQLFGLQNAWVVAQAVSLRGLAVVAGGALLVVLLVLALIRPLRRLLGPLTIVVLLFVIANTAILGVRGIGPGEAAATGGNAGSEASTGTGTSTGTAAPKPSSDVTVLSWNTLGDAPGAAAIAKLALAHEADIISLPETTEATGVTVAELMRAAGRPMWVHTIAFDQVSKARSTTLLISPDLGEYEVKNAAGSGPPGNTNVLPTVVATPVDGVGPTVIAVHAVAPIQEEMSNWRSDLDWLARQCAGGNVIMAGDFNATVDHMAGRTASGADGTHSADDVLGACHDAAISAGSGAVGTWPANAPALLGSPIDHVLASSGWRVTGMSVIETSDQAGSDHRPIVARLVEGAGTGTGSGTGS
jgi:endonuclease/exonuclease/phosphatase (EEP) superfamily protein YafD